MWDCVCCGAYLHGGALFSGALLHRGPCSAVLFSTAGPVQRCSSPRRALFSGALIHGGALFSGALLHRGPCSAVLFSTAGPVQRCSSPRRALFSGALLHGGALFSGALLHRGPCSAVLFSTAGPVQRCLSPRRGPVQRCSSAPRALFSGALLHGGALFSGALLHRGPCSAVLFSTAGPVQRCLSPRRGPVQRCSSPRRGPVQRCSSAPRALFSGAHPAGQGSQTWHRLPAQSPSDRDVSGPFGDGLLASLVSSFPAGMWHVGSTFSALLLPFRSFDGALGPLPPPDGVGGEVAAHCSLGAALSVLARRSLVLRVLLPGGGAGRVLAAAQCVTAGKGWAPEPRHNSDTRSWAGGGCGALGTL
ncbi:hypothetical protein NDU88_005531 [Pleurodeles waltl]|uniref:Uncharacterized protein n=1 Tax=Pleurodeles waltl TaxID=8319 RepID=A0AAV7SLY2_PLEWA|nr:hypothetical protein NDU88_005531 [Pleurodeles waltl]